MEYRRGHASHYTLGHSAEQGLGRSALGGPPRRVAGLGGGDVSHDGRRIALFNRRRRIELVTMARDSQRLVAAVMTASIERRAGRQIVAGVSAHELGFNNSVDIVLASGGTPRAVARSAWLKVSRG